MGIVGSWGRGGKRAIILGWWTVWADVNAFRMSIGRDLLWPPPFPPRWRRGLPVGYKVSLKQGLRVWANPCAYLCRSLTTIGESVFEV